MKRFLALILALVMCFSLVACGAAEQVTEETIQKSESLIAAEKAVKEIGEVSLDSGEAIEKAETAISSLTDVDKEAFGLQKEFDDAKKKYEQLVLENAVAEVENLIAAIGEVTIENSGALQAAQSKYDALDDQAKQLVKNVDALNSANEKLANEKRTRANALLSTMRVDEDRVRNLKFYYPKGWLHYDEYWAADIKSFVLPYIGVQGNDVWLRMVCNYTGDDWVFFKKITFSVDGNNFYKTFNYFDIVHDNSGGTVWEYIDVEVGATEIEILKAIANSNETIIRFEGDDYYRDFIISAGDKAGIAEALTVYELLK